MPHPIEIISVGGNFDAQIKEVATALNSGQNEFQFALAPDNLRDHSKSFFDQEFHTEKIWTELGKYRESAKGHRPFLIAVVDRKLNSKRWDNLFGSHRAENGLAVITLFDHDKFVESYRPFLAYYLIRYALSFVQPNLKSHKETRGCFFDFKERKADLAQSLDSGNFCDDCRSKLWQSFNPQIHAAVQTMVSQMKALRANSQAELTAESRKGHTDIGIITIRADEFNAMLNRFASRRNMRSKVREYQYAWLRTKMGKEITVAIGRSPEQGQGAAQALASNMMEDLEPRWILVVGIAGGFPDFEYTLGDVLLSSRMHDFAVNAAIEGKPPAFQDLGGPMTVEVENLVTNLDAHDAELGNWNSPESIGRRQPNENVPPAKEDDKFYGSEVWRTKTFKSLKKHFSRDQTIRKPHYFGAPVITGNTLLKDTQVALIWQQTARHAAGVEMELGGVCRAARYGRGPVTHVLGIRGLSDIIGYARAPEWTEYACHSAAALAYELIRSGLIRSP